ncbi:MAG: hypothetical protein AAGJ35_01870, partial [Myxococcota bacterium]
DPKKQPPMNTYGTHLTVNPYGQLFWMGTFDNQVFFPTSSSLNFQQVISRRARSLRDLFLIKVILSP